MPSLPATCRGGDVGENVYTDRDMIPEPFSSHGHAHCNIQVSDGGPGIRIEAQGVRLVMEETAKYIEHIRSE